MNFAEQAPSTQWAALTATGEQPAEVWFKPDGEELSVAFRVPQERFEIDDLLQQLTVEDLLQAAGIAKDEVESWQTLDESHDGLNGTNPELQRLLPAPPAGEAHLTVRVRLKSAELSDTPAEDLPPEKWQALEVIWKAILSIEAAIEGTRQSLEGVRSEMESEFRRSLNVDEKVNALQGDVAQWNKAKNRIHYTLPKVREYIHRATWAQAQAERKRLEDLFRNHIEPRVPFPNVDREREKLEHLQKDRQVLASVGSAVYQECRGVTSEVQRALSTLQRNAADRARNKRSASKEKGKHF